MKFAKVSDWVSVRVSVSITANPVYIGIPGCYGRLLGWFQNASYFRSGNSNLLQCSISICDSYSVSEFENTANLITIFYISKLIFEKVLTGTPGLFRSEIPLV
jgi:hypothetical protein